MTDFVELSEAERAVLAGTVLVMLQAAEEKVQLTSPLGIQLQAISAIQLIALGSKGINDLLSKLQPDIAARTKEALKKRGL